ncbi:Ribonucleoprotein complex SRP, Srp19 component [Methanococcus vannielii SB]|jgi:signal recognition particle subunit SRP19|uniref:Signal recognition particle 19 kDa protein n=1 Tax=Methanococcus vannielii (strain ATCC 35089 / DSM 1224 / JCM 13029 / OCM 148 / SB) TaxID=406327 RepID=SRP19_METVS|nr:signal recognition particle subunit SRP19/SEC65 family protein [Methanococcus vannielii]A6UPB8.1 RecName: Full=Signal recognition particle 19 kDa protein; Short=SRP19 [Methanococcus vannielii SB]ABR54340.1 Ribonucleoprotein complex SRP, Srp19 component [Methanococcus vannielii SB]
MKEIVIWPAYFDLKRTKNEGRKVPKSFGVLNPKLKDIVSIIEKMGHEYSIDNKKSYPKEPWEICGYLKVTIDEKTSKLDFLKELCKRMK